MMGEVPPLLHSFEFNRYESCCYCSKSLFNLGNTDPNPSSSHLPPLPSHYPQDWHPSNRNGFNGWNRSSVGMFPSTLVGPGQNPIPLSHPRPASPTTPDQTSTENRNTRKRKRAIPSYSTETSSVGGYGPTSPELTTAGTGSPTPSPPPPVCKRRLNGADDVWAFACPLRSQEMPPVNQWPASLEPQLASKPQTKWFGCKLCLQARYASHLPTTGIFVLIS